MAERRLFQRDTSGLERTIGPVTAVLLSVGFAVGWGWQSQIFIFAGTSPLPENLWFAGIPPGVMSYAIGGIIVIFIMLGYSILVSAMPRTGGGYVAISRIVSPFAAFIGCWFEFISITLALGCIAVFLLKISFYLAGPALLMSPPLNSSYDYVGMLAGGLFLIVLMTAIVALGPRITGYVVQISVWIPAALFVYVLYLLGVAIANPATLQSGVSAWAQAHGVPGVTADTYVKAALAQGLNSASVGNYWTAVSVSLLGAYVAYSGYAALTFVAGEIKDPKRNLPKVAIIAPTVIVIMYVTMAAFASYAAAAVGQTTLPDGSRWSFFEAFSYLTNVGGLQQAGLPNIWCRTVVIASMIETGLGMDWLGILLLAFTVLWLGSDIPPMILAASRIIFAMSFDGVLPVSFSKVNERFHSPVYATVLVGILATLGALGEAGMFDRGGPWWQSGAVGDLLNKIFSIGVFSVELLNAVFFSLFALAVVLLPFRQKRLYESAYFKPGGRLGVVAIGLASLIANLVIAWLILISPDEYYNILSPTPANWFALEFTVFLGVVGSLIYAYYRFGPSSKEIDYSRIFSQLPPE